MKSIEKTFTSNMNIKNSKFISLLVPVKTKEEIKNVLESVKYNYPKANHYCYGYILENDKGISDDGEPSKTAGAPILTILEKEDLINVIAIVIRYFGGIKLGPGGLIRAYSHSTQQTIREAEIYDVTYGFRLEISFPFSSEKEINRYLPKAHIISRHYDTLCHYIVETDHDRYLQLKSRSTIHTKKKILIKKRV